MNRKSLFGRLAKSMKVLSTAERQEYFRVHLEPLEERKLLAQIYYNDDWENETSPLMDPLEGHLVGHATDFGTVSGLVYGEEAFGRGEVAGGGDWPLIKDAIGDSDVLDGDTLNIAPGTHFESDIVVDKLLLVKGAAGNLIVPGQTSDALTADFASGTHSGIIIYASSVTIQNINLDGNGNTNLTGSLHYHQGITTLYTAPGGFYQTANNGSISAIQLGDAGFHGANETEPWIEIDGVTVKNVFWHGITLSARADESFNPGGDNPNNNAEVETALIVHNSTVMNVGDVKDLNRIGILVQNISDAKEYAEDDPKNHTLLSDTIDNVGIGIKQSPYGTSVFYQDGDPGWAFGEFKENGPNNGASAILSKVSNAAGIAFDLEYGHRGTGGVWQGLVATDPSTATGTGFFILHNKGAGVGYVSDGYNIGLHVQDTRFKLTGGLDDIESALSNGAIITGPGSGISGSVGVLVDNDSGRNNSTDFLLAGGATIQDFQTGVHVVQNVAPPDTRVSLLIIDRINLSGNDVDVRVGQGSVLQGGSDLGAEVIIEDDGQVTPTHQDNPDDPDRFLSTPKPSVGAIPAPPNAAFFGATSITLGSTTKFNALLTGQTASTTLFDFNSSIAFTSALLPPGNLAPTYDGSFTQFDGVPSGAMTTWNGQVTQDGSGQVVVGGTATNGYLASAFYGFNMLSTNVVNSVTTYYLNPTDISTSTYLNVKAKLDAPTDALATLMGLMDKRGNLWFYTFEMNALNTSTYSTVDINLMSPMIKLIPHTVGAVEDDGFDLKNVVGYFIAGDQGLLNGNQDTPYNIRVDELTTSSQKTSALVVTGSIDLGGATLAGTVRPGYNPDFGEEFTIVNNQGGTVTGSFAGLDQDDLVTFSGIEFQIDYSGGTGDDVVLIRPNYDSTVVGRNIFYNQSKWDGNGTGPGVADNSAIATDKSAYFVGGGSFPVASTTSYTKGINGIMIDLTGTHGTLTASDFNFKMSGQLGFGKANATTSLWFTAPAPISITVLADTPSVGTDRVELIWANAAIKDRYLEVKIKGDDTAGGNNQNTGLAATDVFYYGNKVGDDFTGTGSSFTTNSTDQVGARDHFSIFGVTRANIWDFDRSASVNSTDQVAARDNNGVLTRVTITAPSAPEGAPAVDDGDGDGSGSAIASALAASTTSSGGGTGSSWIAASLASSSVESGPVATALAQMVEGDTPRSTALAGAADDAEDSVLDSLLNDLGLG